MQQLRTMTILLQPIGVEVAELRNHIALVRASSAAIHKTVRLIGTDILQPAIQVVHSADAISIKIANTARVIELFNAAKQESNIVDMIGQRDVAMRTPLDGSYMTEIDGHIDAAITAYMNEARASVLQHITGRSCMVVESDLLCALQKGSFDKEYNLLRSWVVTTGHLASADTTTKPIDAVRMEQLLDIMSVMIDIEHTGASVDNQRFEEVWHVIVDCANELYSTVAHHLCNWISSAGFTDADVLIAFLKDMSINAKFQAVDTDHVTHADILKAIAVITQVADILGRNTNSSEAMQVPQ